MKLHKPEIFTDGGPWAEHDHACSVCHERHSILYLNEGTFLPCRKCQKDGWQLIYAPWLLKFLRMIGALK
jgi:hypothetical protein